MASVRLPWFLFATILLTASISWWHAYPELPERIASHFNGAGLPNGWITKDQFFTLNAFLVVMAVFTGLFPPFMIAEVAPSLINLPNKDYWLALGSMLQPWHTFGGGLLGLPVDCFSSSRWFCSWWWKAIVARHPGSRTGHSSRYLSDFLFLRQGVSSRCIVDLRELILNAKS